MGIVGANGTGKSTLLKVLAGIEGLDYGIVTTHEGRHVGLSSAGRPLAFRAHRFRRMHDRVRELRALEEEQEELAPRMAELDPASPEYAQIADRFHQRRKRIHARATATRSKSQVGAVLAGLGFAQRRLAAPHRRVFRRLADAHRAGEAAARKAEPAAARRADQSPRPRSAQLARRVSRGLSERIRADLARPLLPRRHGQQDRRDLEQDGCTFYTGGYHAVRGAERPSAARSSRPRTHNQRDRIEQLEAFINRFRAQATKAKQVQSRIKELEKIERIEIPPDEKTIHFTLPAAQAERAHRRRVQERVEELRPKHVSSRMPNFIIERGDRVALVGVNGAGKSTLIKILAGAEPVTTGEYTLGHNVAARLLRAGSVQGARSRTRRMLDDLANRRAARHQYRTAQHSGLLPVLRRRRVQADRRALAAASATATRWRAC